jgi:coenzyme F420-dependent glucose-6-phosphate dehydrogenase
MLRLGYKLSSEEHAPTDLVRYARRAEQVGFSFAAISDHIHPWIDRQGHSPFVWGVIGAIAHATERLEIVTGVTCPTIRMHPVIAAHAAATAACLLPGRFAFGVGSGEQLNEHVTGAKWPPAQVRLDMLEEAIDVIRKLWRGELTSHRGVHFTVENARLYDVPDQPPPIFVAASGDRALTLAGRAGDGFIGLAPDAEQVKKFHDEGGEGKPSLAEVNVCYAATEDEARAVVKEWWPVAGLGGGQLMQELALPSQFEAACEPVSPEAAAETVACGNDPERHLEEIRKFVDAGYTHIWIHQIGPDQEGFFDFYEGQVLPKLS